MFAVPGETFRRLSCCLLIEYETIMIRPISTSSDIHSGIRRTAIRTLLALCATVAVILTTGPVEVFAQGKGPRELDPPVSMGEEINTPYSELQPIVTPDGEELYFVRKYYPLNTGGASDPDDIYMSRRKANGKWEKPENVGPPLNSEGSDALFWFSEDGSKALVHSGMMVDGKELGLAIATRRNGTWSTPKKITIRGLENLSEYYQATVSPDGKHMMLAINRDTTGNKYNYDIYYSPALSDDLMEWAEPMKLGSGINTVFAEAAPYIGPDGRSLYFSSDRPGSYVSGNLYVSRRTGDDWLEWTTPRPLGEDVNTPLYDAGISIYDDVYFLSRVAPRVKEDTYGGYGRLDLYTRVIDSTIKQGLDFQLAGKLIDKTTRQGVEGEIRLTIVQTGKKYATTISDEVGDFSITLMPGWIYKVVGSAPGYRDGSTTIDFRLDASQPIYDLTIEMEPGTEADPGRRVPTANEVPAPTILFPTGSAELDATALTALQNFYKELRPALSENKVGSIRLIGHTDNVGDPEENQLLSERRAEAVREGLVRMGVPSGLLSTSGQGETVPTATNQNARGRMKNRRVDILMSVAPEERIPNDTRNPIPIR